MTEKAGYTRYLIALILCVLFATKLSHASEQEMDSRLDMLFGQHQVYKDFFYHFQKAMAAHDKAAVADMIDYPARFNKSTKNRTWVKNRKAFILNYDKIMNSVIYNAVKNQRYDDLFANSHGLLYGNGNVCFRGVCEDTHTFYDPWHPCDKVVVKVFTFNAY